MAGNFLFYYFGDDEAYFRALQGEFELQTRMALDFRRIFESEESKIQSLILKIFKEQPAAVFIDFSKQTQDYLHLARLIARTPLEHKMVTVGLVDYLSPPEVLPESIATGVNLSHIKSTETFDVVFGVTKIIAPQEIGEHGFATAKLKEEWEAGFPGKVGYVTPGGLHLETNCPITKGSRIKIRHYWQEKKIVPSGAAFVKDISKQNLFYHFKGSADLDFLFVDELIMTDGVDPDEWKQKKKEREEVILAHKEQLKKWLTDNGSSSQEKRGKLLVVDREMRFYEDQQRSDRHPYVIRTIPYLEDISAELDRLRPQVIAFALDAPEMENPRNTHHRVVKLAETIKMKYKDLSPFIIVFNAPVSSKEMQEVLAYNNVMAIESELSVELLVKMADIFEKKKMASVIPGGPASEKVFLSKSSPATLCEVLFDVKVIKLSETDMYLESDRELPIGSNLHLFKPVEMYVNIQPTKNPSNPPVYHGIIHCLGEDEKKELRRYVNSIFFREHDAAQLNEIEEFKRLNEAKLQERLAAEEAAKPKKVSEDTEAAPTQEGEPEKSEA